MLPSRTMRYFALASPDISRLCLCISLLCRCRQTSHGYAPAHLRDSVLLLFDSIPFLAVSIRCPSTPLLSASSRHNAHAALCFSQLCQGLSVPNNALAYPIIAHQCRCVSTLYNAFAIPGPSFLCHRSRWSMHCPRRTNHIESTPSLNYAVPLRIAALPFPAMPMQSRSTLFQRQSWPLHAVATHDLAMPMRFCSALRRRNAFPFNACAKLCVSDAVHSVSVAEQCFALPLRHQSHRSVSTPSLITACLCHCFTSPNYATASQCSSSSLPFFEMPPEGTVRSCSGGTANLFSRHR